MTIKTRIESAELEIDRHQRVHLPAPRLSYRPVGERVRDFGEACQGFTPETAREEAVRCIECPSPQGCILACPLHNDIPAAMWEISRGNFLEAAAIYRQTSNFPELCGRLCPDESLCAGSCGIGKAHASVRMGRLEAFVADYQRVTEGDLPVPPIPPPTGHRVAVVGSGPAGLTVAEELARLGHAITIIEMQPKPGGMLVYTIPRFRLPLPVVEAKIAQLKGMGVQFTFETCIGREVALDDLFGQGYEAVFLGTGAGFEEAMNLSGAELAGVYRATEFLLQTNLDLAYHRPGEPTPIVIGERVAVFGSGHSAVDCARTAIRLGAREVICYIRGRENDMQCRYEDKLAAEEEQVRFVALVEPIGFIGNDRGQVRQVQCQHMRLEGQGRWSQPIPVEGSTFTVEAEVAVLAPDRSPDRRLLETSPGLKAEPEGWLICDEETGQTSRPGVFAAGDVTGESQLAVLAIASGRKVAASIHRYLSTKTVEAEGANQKV